MQCRVRACKHMTALRQCLPLYGKGNNHDDNRRNIWQRAELAQQAVAEVYVSVGEMPRMGCVVYAVNARHLRRTTGVVVQRSSQQQRHEHRQQQARYVYAPSLCIHIARKGNTFVGETYRSSRYLTLNSTMQCRKPKFRNGVCMPVCRPSPGIHYCRDLRGVSPCKNTTAQWHCSLCAAKTSISPLFSFPC